MNQVDNDVHHIVDGVSAVIDDRAHEIRGVVAVKILHPHAQHLFPHGVPGALYAVGLCLYLSCHCHKGHQSQDHII